MLPSSASASQPFRRVGVGIDTSRYGHYACFLGDDLQPAAAELSFAESAAGYAQLRHPCGKLPLTCFARSTWSRPRNREEAKVRKRLTS